MGTALFLLFAVFATVSGRVFIGNLPTQGHSVSGKLYAEDETTFTIEDFTYDGTAPDALLYYYTGDSPPDRNGGGIIIPFSDSSEKLPRRYNGETITFDIVPVGTTVDDITYFTIWCRAAKVFFTQIVIPDNLDFSSGGTPPPVQPHENCVPLDSSLQARWSVDRDAETITVTLCGCNSNSNITQYMGFGLSGSESGTLMLEADPVIAYIDENFEPQAKDYFLSGYTQCLNGVGACPDTLNSDAVCPDNVFDVSGYMKDGVECVTYSRAFDTGDADCDKVIDVDNTQQYIVWALGPLGETAFKHFTRATMSTPSIHLGRDPLDECMETPLECEKCPSFEAKQIFALKGRTFSARIGSSGAERGYTAITGMVGWGISWYIDEQLIPELILKRGETYTFMVEGGNDPALPADYHPFYITDSPEGAILNDLKETPNERVFAGFDASNNPTGVGRLCDYKETEQSSNVRLSCASFEEYFDALDLQCTDGDPGVVTWTPDDSTPDVVYYQCATHLGLGWKITFSSAPANIVSMATAFLLTSLSYMLL